MSHELTHYKPIRNTLCALLFALCALIALYPLYLHFMSGINHLSAKNYIMKGYYGLAVERLKAAMAYQPSDYEIKKDLGEAYFELGNLEAAQEAYKKAKLHSKKATEKERLQIEVIFAQWVERDTDKRFRLLEEWAAKYPKEKDAHYELGSYYHDKRRYDEAVQEFQKVLHLDPNMGAALNMLAYTYADMEDYEKALEGFERYAEAMPEDANPLDSMAELYFKMGKLDEAIKKYNETLDIDLNFGCESRLAYIYALKQD